MKMIRNFVIFPLLLLIKLSLSFLLLDNCEILDLTHDYSSNTKYWGMKESFKLETVFKGVKTPENFYYEAFKFSGPEHGGTHLDAPNHFSSTGMKNDEIPLVNLIGEACVVDVTSKVTINPDYELTVADLNEWETKYGQLTDRCILVMRTGWESKYSNTTELFGTKTPQDPKTYHFPGLSPQAAKWLVDSNRLKSFAIDTPSVDYGPSIEFKVHQILMGKNLTGLENLMNVGRLPARGATIIALPMKIKGGSGGPVRVIAFGWNGPQDPCLQIDAAVNVAPSFYMFTVLMCLYYCITV